MANSNPPWASIKVSCQEDTPQHQPHEWTQGKEERVWTERVNNGCFTIVFLSTKACYLYHVGQLAPNGHDLWNAVDGSQRIQSAWPAHCTMVIIKMFRACKLQLQDAELWIIAPTYEVKISDTQTAWRIPEPLQTMRRNLRDEIGLTQRTIEYKPKKPTQIAEGNRSFVEVVAQSLGNGEINFYVDGVLQTRV